MQFLDIENGKQVLILSFADVVALLGPSQVLAEAQGLIAQFSYPCRSGDRSAQCRPRDGAAHHSAGGRCRRSRELCQ